METGVYITDAVDKTLVFGVHLPHLTVIIYFALKSMTVAHFSLQNWHSKVLKYVHHMLSKLDIISFPFHIKIECFRMYYNCYLPN